MKWRFIFALLIALVCCKKSYSEELIPFDEMKTFYVAEDNTPVYEKPGYQEKSIIELNILDFVYLIEKTELNTSNGNIENWYFVDTSKKTNFNANIPTIKGWILSKYLLGKNHFKPVKKMQEMFIIATYPDWSDYYHIYPNGTFISKNPFDKKSKGYRGKVYKYKNIISLNFKEFFYYNEEGELQGRFSDVEVITNKKKFPF